MTTEQLPETTIRVRAAKAERLATEEEFERELRELSANGTLLPCQVNPAPFVDYVSAPAPKEAKKLCAGCPMAAGDNLCFRFAEAKKETYGVWGGFAFNVTGRPLRMVLPEKLQTVG